MLRIDFDWILRQRAGSRETHPTRAKAANDASVFSPFANLADVTAATVVPQETVCKSIIARREVPTPNG
jgi:hypothetical protein